MFTKYKSLSPSRASFHYSWQSSSIHCAEPVSSVWSFEVDVPLKGLRCFPQPKIIKAGRIDWWPRSLGVVSGGVLIWSSVIKAVHIDFLKTSGNLVILDIPNIIMWLRYQHEISLLNNTECINSLIGLWIDDSNFLKFSSNYRLGFV